MANIHALLWGVLVQGIVVFCQTSSSNKIKPDTKPTLKGVEGFNDEMALTAAEKFYKGIHKGGFFGGTNEGALNEVASTHSLDQRMKIKEAYKKKYDKDIIKDIKGDTEGSYEGLLVSLFKPTIQVVCHDLRQAVKGAGTDEETMMEILATYTQTDKMKKELATVYKDSYAEKGDNLEQAITNDLLMTNTGELFTELLDASRGDDEFVYNEESAADIKKKAECLFKESSRWPDTKDDLKATLFTTQMDKLRLVCEEFQKLSGKRLHEVIGDKIDGTKGKLLKHLAHFAENHYEYYAVRIHEALDAFLHTHDRMLIRIVVTHCETDLGNIQETYEKLFNKPMVDDIKDDTSKDYQKLLLLLNGKK